MNPTYIGDISLDEETLTHYGVLGMKWGVRKDPQRAWAKANTELTKRRKKSGERTKKKVARLSRRAQKANKKASKRFSTEEQKAKAFKANYKLDKAMKKSAKADRRTARWERQMDKAFQNTEFAKVKKNGKSEKNSGLGFREIRTSEKITDKKQEHQEYKQIKPSTHEYDNYKNKDYVDLYKEFMNSGSITVKKKKRK